MLRFALSLCLLLAVLTSGTAQKQYEPDWASLDTRPTPNWWLDAKFGIFIHWGVYSVPAFTAKGNYAEWYQHSLNNNSHNGAVRQYHKQNYGKRTYYDLADDFHAELYNPDDWAQLFEKAGAKYVVLTSKHHDGFCLWPNQQANDTWEFPWNAMDAGPKRDLLGDLFASLRKTSVKPGLYFSLYEWFNPLWKSDPERFATEHTMPQLYELVETYRPAVVWSDGDWDASPETWHSPEFLTWLYNESPVRDSVVVNDRWGSGVRFKHGGIYTPEYQPDMDFEDHAWEESRGMGFSYGYNRLEDAWDYNSSQSLILHLIDKVSRGGNFLLDIGPDAHGQIPPIMQERLIDIGKWLEVNGEAIYNTRRWRTNCQWSEGDRNFKPEMVDGWKTGGDFLLKQTIDPEKGFAVKEAFFTWNPKTKSLYVILPKYPDNKKLVLKDIKLPANTLMSFLATGDKLKWEASGNNTVVTLPEYNPNKIKAQHAYVIKIANYGAFVASPKIDVRYDPKTLKPVVTMSAPTGVGIRYTTDGSMPTDTSALYKTPLTITTACTVRARAFKAGVLPSNDASAEVKIYRMMPAVALTREPDPGLKKMYVSPDKYTIESVEKGDIMSHDYVEDFTLGEECKNEKCALVWKGFINIETTGAYKFWTESDDGSKLYIDNQAIVDNGGDHGMTEQSGMAFLQKGWHTFKLVYFNSAGDSGLKVHFSPNGKPKEELPFTLLGH